MRIRSWLLILIFTGAVPASGGEGKITPPPEAEIERLKLDPFYRKHLSVNEFPIVTSEEVSDFALLEAAYLIEKMLGNRPDILEAINEAGVRFAIMAPGEFTTDIPEHSDKKPPKYWDKRARGLGSSPKGPAVSCGEENLLDYKGDPYARENIFIHEFAHTIHHQGLKTVDPDFQKRLESTFAKAKLQGLWKSKYAGTNPSEYWAEGVQSWFDCNRENDYEHNYVNTREELKKHDPGLARLVGEVFGDRKWRYRKPKDRKEPGHLAGFDPETAPAFEWPSELVAAYEAIQRGDHLEKLEALPLASLTTETRSPRTDRKVRLRIDNRRDETVKIFWINFEGEPQEYSRTDPERSFDQHTYAGHLWLVTDPDDKPLALFAPGDKPCLAVVKNDE